MCGSLGKEEARGALLLISPDNEESKYCIKFKFSITNALFDQQTLTPHIFATIVCLTGLSAKYFETTIRLVILFSSFPSQMSFLTQAKILLLFSKLISNIEEFGGQR